MRSELVVSGTSFAFPKSLAKGGGSMSLERRRMKRMTRSKNEKRLMKESLREFLGSGLLDSKSNSSMSLYLLKDALNSQILNPKLNKN